MNQKGANMILIVVKTNHVWAGWLKRSHPIVQNIQRSSKAKYSSQCLLQVKGLS